MSERSGASWLVYALGALCAGAIAAAILVVGPPSSSQAGVTRTATAARGVVQSTVSGSGNLQPLSQLDLGFSTSGTVTHIYVAQGQHVAQGQLIATLDPQSAEVTLEQAKAALQSAQADLAKEQETDGESASGQGSSGAGSSGAGSSGAASASASTVREAAATSASAGPVADAPTTAAPADATPTTTAPAGATPTTTVPASSAPTTTTAPAGATTPASTTSPSDSSTTTGRRAAGKAQPRSSSGSSSGSSSSQPGASSTSSTLSAATREANLASARAAVRSAELTVHSDEHAVQSTRLYAPESGTIVSLSGQVGEVVSASGTTRASSAASSSGGSESSSAGSDAAASARAGTGAASSSGSAGSSGSTFAVLSDLSSMQLVAPLSESEIGHVKVGQIATVTVEALEGRKLAAHVSEIAILSTSNSGVVSYDVTFQLDQMDPGLKPGMSANAEVVVAQAEGINVPSSAIAADTVTVLRGGEHVRRRVVTGLTGNSTTIVRSGLKAGETVVLPTATTSATGASSLLSRLGSRLGGAGALGGGLGGGGGGGAALFRGGG
jgi:multidrug efflux pump subunit AcrA (membrane-fusion protein)